MPQGEPGGFDDRETRHPVLSGPDSAVLAQRSQGENLQVERDQHIDDGIGRRSTTRRVLHERLFLSFEIIDEHVETDHAWITRQPRQWFHLLRRDPSASAFSACFGAATKGRTATSC